MGPFVNIRRRLLAERDRGKAVLLVFAGARGSLAFDRICRLAAGELAGVVRADRTDENQSAR